MSNSSRIPLDIDDYNLEEVVAMTAAFGTDRYGYLVTPNVDHILRHYDDSDFRALYAHASYVLLDSRFLARVISLFKRQTPRTCLGSDLTAAIFSSVLKPRDVAVLVGASAAQAEQLRQRFQLQTLHHIDPPMNLLSNPEAIEHCLRQIESIGTFRFCFLAIGSPQQEVIARRLQQRGQVRGLALCIGASVNFMTGSEKRAPLWMQQAGIEWLFRLLQNPQRMGARYLVRGPRIFILLPRLQLRLRRSREMAIEIDTATEAIGADPIGSISGRSL